ncbi:MAG: hypothetical protein ACI81R_003623 [Bradymonadia bacterium]|jgi:hypothetical protein
MARSVLSLAAAAAFGATVVPDGAEKAAESAQVVLDHARNAVASLDLAHLTRGLQLDAIHGDTPPSARDFEDYARGMLDSPVGADTSRDPWGGQYWLETRGGVSFVHSAGPDGVADTADDLMRSAPTSR